MKSQAKSEKSSNPSPSNLKIIPSSWDKFTIPLQSYPTIFILLTPFKQFINKFPSQCDSTLESTSFNVSHFASELIKTIFNFPRSRSIEPRIEEKQLLLTSARATSKNPPNFPNEQVYAFPESETFELQSYVENESDSAIFLNNLIYFSIFIYLWLILNAQFNIWLFI